MTGLGLDDGWLDIIVLHDGTTMQTHGPARCAGRACCIHRPSNHPLATAPMQWMPEINLMLRICEHGSVHPDPDSLAWLMSRFTSYDGWHPCCPGQCCLPLVERED